MRERLPQACLNPASPTSKRKHRSSRSRPRPSTVACKAVGKLLMAGRSILRTPVVLACVVTLEMMVLKAMTEISKKLSCSIRTSMVVAWMVKPSSFHWESSARLSRA